MRPRRQNEARPGTDPTRIPGTVDLRKIPELFECPPKRSKKEWPCRIVSATNPKTGKKVMLRIPRQKGRVIFSAERAGAGKNPWFWQQEGRTTAGNPYTPRSAERLSADQLKAIQFAATLRGKPVDKAMECLRQNALFVLNLSGGKDSQAMWLYLTRGLQIPLSNIYAIHADLPGADWPKVRLPSGRIAPSVIDHLQATTELPVDVVVARWGSGEIKTFDSLVRHAKKKGVAHPFPSPKIRQCTSDLKRGPIRSATLTKLCTLNGLEVRRGGGCGSVAGYPWRIVINCMGLRAEESWGRESQLPWKLDIENSKEGRAWFTWLPIQQWTTDQVFREIFKHGQEPFWTYGKTPEHMAMIRERIPGAKKGMSRLSCQFCIMADRHDVSTAAQLAPAAYARRCELEDQMESSMMMGGKKLPELTGVIPVKQLLRKRRNPDPWEGLEESPLDDPFLFDPDDIRMVTALRGSADRSDPVSRLRKRLL